MFLPCPRIAHRGCSSTAPENTMAAFRQAIDLGVEGIELDVHQSADGQLVVIHDATLSGTTSGRGYVNERTLSELKKLDAGAWFNPAFASERIPTLEEVLSFIDGRCTVFIEVKQGRKPYPGIEEKVLKCINDLKMRDTVVLHAFEKDTLHRIHRLDESIPIYLDLFFPPVLGTFFFDRVVLQSSILKYKTLKGVSINHHALSPRLVRKVHALGLQVLAWTVNKPQDIQRMKSIGVDTIISNFPERL